MNLTEEQYELAERYLAGLLSGKELSDFERMLEENPVLKDQTEKIRKVNELMFIEGLKTELPTIQKAQEHYFFRQQLKYYSKWMGGFLILATTMAIIWTFVGKDEPKTDIVVTGKKSGSADSVIAITKSETKVLVQPFSPNSSPVVTTKEEPQNPEVVEESKTDPQEKNILPTVVQKDTLVKKIIPVIKEDPCKELITGTFETVASCENKSEGSIRILSISGGEKPYMLSLDNGKYRETKAFQFLSDGEYQLHIKDAKGCSSKSYIVKVPAKSCAVTSNDYIFSYQNTQEFIFPNLNESDFLFQVYNSSGGMEYSIEVTNRVPSSWNGYGTTGQKLSIGSYSFRFTNSANKVLQQGTITIVD